MGFAFSPAVLRRPPELENGDIHLAVGGVGRAGVGQGERRRGGRPHDQRGRARGAGAGRGGGKVDAVLQMGGAVIAGRHLHIIGLAEQPRHRIIDEIIPRRQGDLLEALGHDVPPGIGHVWEHLNQAVPGQRRLVVDEGGEAVPGELPDRTGGASRAGGAGNTIAASARRALRAGGASGAGRARNAITGSARRSRRTRGASGAGGAGGAGNPLAGSACRPLRSGGTGRGDVKRKVAINPQTMGNYKKIKSITLRMEPSGTTWAAFLRG